MRKRKQPRLLGRAVLGFCLALLVCPVMAQAQMLYSITDLGKSNELANVWAINDRGQAVGTNGHALLWAGGKQIDLGTLKPQGIEDETTAVAYGISNRGVIVGSSGSFAAIFGSGLQHARGFIVSRGTPLHQWTSNNVSFIPYAVNDKGEVAGLDGFRGFFFSGSKLADFKTLSTVPAGNLSTARGLNQLGQVVGWSTVNSPHRDQYGRLPTHGFLWQRGVNGSRMRDLGTLPGRVNSYAYGINRRGEVVGSATDSAGNSETAFLWRTGKMIALEALPDTQPCEAFGINDSSVIVGRSGARAAAWARGKITDLTDCLPPGSGWTLEVARAINNRGQIAGSSTFNGQKHLFLLTPKS